MTSTRSARLHRLLRVSSILLLLFAAPFAVACKDGGNALGVTVPANAPGEVGRLSKLSAVATGSGSGSATYDWSQTTGPTVALVDDDTATPSFRAREVGTYGFTVTVENDAGDTAAATQTLDVHSIDGGENHTVALKPDGTLLAWGYNIDGQLGDSTDLLRTAPVRVCNTGATDCDADPLTGVVAISAGRAQSLALKSDGTVWAWGSNVHGALGDGTFDTRYTPVQVCAYGETAPCSSFLSDVIAIEAGYYFSAALHVDGTVSSWGFNYNGELGQGALTAPVHIPAPVCATYSTGPGCDTVLSSIEVLAAGGGGHTIAIDAAGAAWGWGHNKSGQTGTGYTAGLSQIPLPERVCAEGEAHPCSSFASGLEMVDAWSGTSFALDSSGAFWGWGGNNDDELGAVTSMTCANANPCSDVPVRVCASNDSPCTTPLAPVIDFEVGRRFGMALLANGELRTWGDNLNYQLGDGDNVDNPVPSPVCAVGATGPCSEALSSVSVIASGSYFSFALLSDGTMVGWGENGTGQLGIGNTDDQSVPVVIDDY